MGAKVGANDVLASVVVFLVALPLCLGVAIASGVPAEMGLLSGIVGGIIVGVLAGSPLQVSGPAAGLVVLVAEIVSGHGLEALAVCLVLTGVLQLLSGFLHFGQWFRAVSPAVIYAMLAGIGVIIFASQFHVMLDFKPDKNPVTNLMTIPSALSNMMGDQTGQAKMAAMLGSLSLIILIVWNGIKEKLPPAIGVLPAPLLAVGAATATAAIMGVQNVNYVEVPASVGSMLRFPSPEAFKLLLNTEVLGMGIALAVVASAESMLSAVAVDKLQSGEIRTDYDRELMAQGVGNVVLGFLGGLPITGVIVRSSANVAAGAKTRWSAVMHGFWLLIAIAVLPWALAYIPVASLAAVLVYIGYKLVKVDAIKSLWARGKSEVAIYVITVVCIVGIKLLEGLLIGLALSILKLAWEASRLEVEVVETGPKVLHVDLRGAATFVVLPQLARALDKLPRDAEVHLHMEHLSYVDHACFELIRDWERSREDAGGTLILEWEELERRSATVSRGAETLVERARAKVEGDLPGDASASPG